MFRLFNGNIDLAAYLIQLLVLFGSLCVHEFSHAWTAYRLGDSTAAQMGRLTLNPLAHMDPLGSLMIIMGAPIGWARPVPVNPSRFKAGCSLRRGMALTSVAGPASNLVLAFIGYFCHSLLRVLLLLSHAVPGAFGLALLRYTSLFFILLFQLNIFLAVFNLLPLPPLDGSKIWSIFLPDRQYYQLMRYERQIGLALLLVVFFLPQVLRRVLDVVAWPFIQLISVPLDWLVGLLTGGLV